MTPDERNEIPCPRAQHGPGRQSSRQRSGRRPRNAARADRRSLDGTGGGAGVGRFRHRATSPSGPAYRWPISATPFPRKAPCSPPSPARSIGWFWMRPASALADEAARERLFDVLMRRLDALAPYRLALQSVAEWVRREPLAAAALNGVATNSMRFMLAAAGIEAEGATGAIKLQGLVLAWARVLNVWFEDDDPGLARTMAALDKELARGETWVARVDDLDRLISPLRLLGRALLDSAADAGATGGRGIRPDRRTISTPTRRSESMTPRAGRPVEHDRLRRFPEGRHPGRDHREGRAFPAGAQAGLQARIDFGAAIGVKSSSAQITRHYTPDGSLGRAGRGGGQLPAAPDRPLHVGGPDAGLSGRERGGGAGRPTGPCRTAGGCSEPGRLIPKLPLPSSRCLDAAGPIPIETRRMFLTETWQPSGGDRMGRQREHDWRADRP